MKKQPSKRDPVAEWQAVKPVARRAALRALRNQAVSYETYGREYWHPDSQERQGVSNQYRANGKACRLAARVLSSLSPRKRKP